MATAKEINGATKLAYRWMRTHNPDGWNGEGMMPKSFDSQPADYWIDGGHSIQIKPYYCTDKGMEGWFFNVNYSVCGMTCTTIKGYGIDSTDNIKNAILTILHDNPTAYLERFAKDGMVNILHTRLVPMGGTVWYEEKHTAIDMSCVAIAAYSIFDASGKLPNLNSELLDNDYFGGDADFHIALTVNSTRSTFPDMPHNIVKWAKEYANGDTFDTYFEKALIAFAK